MQPVPERGISLASDLCSSVDIVAAAKSSLSFASALCNALAYHRWFNFATGAKWVCTTGDAGQTVADLRGRGEHYMHIYGYEGADGEPVCYPDDVLPLIAALGWYPFERSFFSVMEAARAEAQSGATVEFAALGPALLDLSAGWTPFLYDNLILPKATLHSDNLVLTRTALEGFRSTLHAMRDSPAVVVERIVDDFGQLLDKMASTPTWGRPRVLPSVPAATVYLNHGLFAFFAHEVRDGTIVVLKVWDEVDWRAQGFDQLW